MRRVQATQLALHSHKQINDLQLEAEQKYLNRKTRLIVKDKKRPAIFVCHIDKFRREYLVKGNPTYISGRINKISVEGNYLIVKPGFWTRLIQNKLRYYIVYVKCVRFRTANKHICILNSFGENQRVDAASARLTQDFSTNLKRCACSYHIVDQ